MEAPKCKLCGDRHYGLCEPVKKLLRNADADPRYKAALAAITPREAAERRAGKFDRTAYHRDYMRDYMRKYRAKLRNP